MSSSSSAFRLTCSSRRKSSSVNCAPCRSLMREPSSRSGGEKNSLFKSSVPLVAVAGFVCALPLIGWHAKPPTADEIADQKRQADESRRAYLDAQKRKTETPRASYLRPVSLRPCLLASAFRSASIIFALCSGLTGFNSTGGGRRAAILAASGEHSITNDMPSFAISK